MIKDKHKMRMGAGCRYEDAVEDNIALCAYAQDKFGGSMICRAPIKCWLDIKLTKKFDDTKHCPNCSIINKPHPLKKINYKHLVCLNCKFELIKWNENKNDQ